MPNRRYPKRSSELASSNQMQRAAPGALHGQSFIPSPVRGERQDVLSYSNGRSIGYAEDRFTILRPFSIDSYVIVGTLTYWSHSWGRRIFYYQKTTGSVRLLEESWGASVSIRNELRISVNGLEPINGDYPQRMAYIEAGDIVICQYPYYEDRQ